MAATASGAADVLADSATDPEQSAVIPCEPKPALRETPTTPKLLAHVELEATSEHRDQLVDLLRHHTIGNPE